MIEIEIEEVVQRLTFNRRLPEFIDRAKYLEGKLQEGEYLTVEMEDLELRDMARSSADRMVLDLYGRKEKPVRAVTLDSLGTISWSDDLFLDYRPIPESKRYPNN